MASSSERRTMLPVLDRWDRIKLPRGPFTAADHWPRQAAARDDGVAYCVPLFLQEGDLQPVGFVNPRILEALLQDCRDAKVAGQAEPWTFLRASATDVSITSEDSFKSIWAVCFADWVNAKGTAGRTAEIGRFVRRGCQQGLFKVAFGEIYAVRAPAESATAPCGSENPDGGIAFYIERKACRFFTVHMGAVALMAYEVDESGRYWLWIQKRGKTKPTGPGLWDLTANGGLPAHLSPVEGVLEEAEQEASFPGEYLRRNMRFVGEHFAVRTLREDGFVYPWTTYLFDIQIRPDVEAIEPRPDGTEVESFSRMSVEEVTQCMLDDQFLGGSASTLLVFLVRHGLVTAENDSQFSELVEKLDRECDILTKPAADLWPDLVAMRRAAGVTR